MNQSSLLQNKDTVKWDDTLQNLHRTIQNGWLEHCLQCAEQLLPYWNFHEEIAVIDGIVIKGTRIIIPYLLQHDILNQLHFPHLGIERARSAVKSTVNWQGINQLIEYVDEGMPAMPRSFTHQACRSSDPL